MKQYSSDPSGSDPSEPVQQRTSTAVTPVAVTPVNQYSGDPSGSDPSEPVRDSRVGTDIQGHLDQGVQKPSSGVLITVVQSSGDLQSSTVVQPSASGSSPVVNQPFRAERLSLSRSEPGSERHRRPNSERQSTEPHQHTRPNYGRKRGRPSSLQHTIMDIMALLAQVVHPNSSLLLTL